MDHRGKTYTVRSGWYGGSSFIVVDYYDKVFELKWKQSLRSKQDLAINYCIEAVLLKLPLDEEPLVGTINGVKLLIHPLQFLTKEEKEKEKELKNGTEHEVRNCRNKEGFNTKKGAGVHNESARPTSGKVPPPVR